MVDGRNEVFNKKLYYIGFTFQKHPTKLNHFRHISVYQIEDQQEYAVCVDEGWGQGEVEKSKEALNTMVLGECVARFIDEFIHQVDEAGLKLLLEQQYPYKWNWGSSQTSKPSLE